MTRGRYYRELEVLPIWSQDADARLAAEQGSAALHKATVGMFSRRAVAERDTLGKLNADDKLRAVAVYLHGDIDAAAGLRDAG